MNAGPVIAVLLVVGAVYAVMGIRARILPLALAGLGVYLVGGGWAILDLLATWDEERDA